MGIRVVDEAFQQQGSKGLIVASEPYSSGVISRFHKRSIPMTAATNMRDIDLTDPTTPKRRQGYKAIPIGTTGIAGGLTSVRPSFLASYQPSSNSKALVIGLPSAGAGAIYRTTNPYTSPWQEIFDADGNSVDALGTDCHTFQANDVLWILPGIGGRPVTVDHTATATVSTITNEDAPAGAVSGVYLLNRVFLLKGRSIYWSNLNPTSPNGTFDQTTQVLSFSPNSAETPIGISAWRDTRLILFFKGSIEEMIVDSSDPSNSARNVIESDVGCSSRASIIAVGDDVYFADRTGHIRSLKRNQQGFMAGVVTTPLSYPISGDIPSQMTDDEERKIRLLLIEERIEVFYPLDPSTEANARFTYDFPGKYWYGRSQFADPVGQIVKSAVKRGLRVYSTNGDDASRAANVYVWGQNEHSDNGSTYIARERTAMLDLGVPEASKRWDYIEVEYYGDTSVSPVVKVQTVEEPTTFGSALTLSSGTGTLTYTSAFPLVPTDFPLVPTDFALTTATPDVARARYSLVASDGTALRSRALRLDITDSAKAAAFERRRWWIHAHIEPFEDNPTDD